MSEKPIRILQVLPAINYCGGIESYVMNYYRHIDRNNVQFDFVTHTNLEPSFKPEIEKMGGKVYELPVFSLRNLKEILKMIDAFFAKNASEYVAVHCHMANAAFFYFRIAKKYGIKNLILHSHQNKAADKLSHAIRNYPLLFLANKLASHRIACTKLAGEFLFGNNSYSIIKNAIEIEKFSYNEKSRKRIRKELNIADDIIVIGHVGRFTAQKNQLFLIRTFYKLQKFNDLYCLALVGAGEDENLLRNEVTNLGLEDKVIFLGPKQNVNDYYQAFDLFVFPSLYEGLGIVLIEAQCSGLPVFVSEENIPNDVKVTDLLIFTSLDSGENIWAKKILHAKKSIRNIDLQSVVDAGYEIKHEAGKLEAYYAGLS